MFSEGRPYITICVCVCVCACVCGRGKADGCIKLLQEALEEHHMCLLKSIVTGFSSYAVIPLFSLLHVTQLWAYSNMWMFRITLLTLSFFI